MNSPPVSVGSLRATLPNLATSEFTRRRRPVRRASNSPKHRRQAMRRVLSSPVQRTGEIRLTGGDERAARHSLRGQVAQLEGRLAALTVDTYPHVVCGLPAG